MRKISLTRGFEALVDDGDFVRLNKYKWFCSAYGYAVRSDKAKHKTIYMHNEIINVPFGMLPDHIDRNKLNNCKDNLRVCSKAQNGFNAKPRVRRAKIKSSFKGVYWFEPKKKWKAQISSYGKSVHIGYFDNEIEAALSYNEIAKKLHGDFAYINEVAA